MGQQEHYPAMRIFDKITGQGTVEKIEVSLTVHRKACCMGGGSRYTPRYSYLSVLGVWSFLPHAQALLPLFSPHSGLTEGHRSPLAQGHSGLPGKVSVVPSRVWGAVYWPLILWGSSLAPTLPYAFWLPLFLSIILIRRSLRGAKCHFSCCECPMDRRDTAL